MPGSACVSVYPKRGEVARVLACASLFTPLEKFLACCVVTPGGSPRRRPEREKRRTGCLFFFLFASTTSQLDAGHGAFFPRARAFSLSLALSLFSSSAVERMLMSVVLPSLSLCGVPLIVVLLLPSPFSPPPANLLPSSPSCLLCCPPPPPLSG